MTKSNFEVLRAGINTTYQDKGRNNLYQIGIPFSGAMDNRNYLLSNNLVGNKNNTPVIEFAYQGPLLKLNGEKICLAITGDVNFNIFIESPSLNFSPLLAPILALVFIEQLFQNSSTSKPPLTAK